MSKSLFTNLIIAGVILLLVIKFQLLFKGYLQNISDMSKTMLTHIEVDKITHQMYIDYNLNSLPLPYYTESGWRDYIQKKSSPSTGKRDPGDDLWGTPLQILNTENISLQLPPGVMVRSAGPDHKMHTSDDITSICKKERE
jgi:hypothetical protein